jgi:hypothetical protein
MLDQICLHLFWNEGVEFIILILIELNVCVKIYNFN